MTYVPKEKPTRDIDCVWNGKPRAKAIATSLPVSFAVCWALENKSPIPDD